MLTKLILIIAGTQWQIPLIEKIHKMGHKVLVLNLYPDSPAFSVADFSEVVDILDKETCLEIAKKYNVDAVLSDECDIATPTIAYIAKQMNLVGISPELASLYTNKYEMHPLKNHLMKFGDSYLTLSDEGFTDKIIKKVQENLELCQDLGFRDYVYVPFSKNGI